MRPPSSMLTASISPASELGSSFARTRGSFISTRAQRSALLPTPRSDGVLLVEPGESRISTAAPPWHLVVSDLHLAPLSLRRGSFLTFAHLTAFILFLGRC